MYITILFVLCAIYYIFYAPHARGFATANNGIEDTGDTETHTSNNIETKYIGENFTSEQIMDLTFAADTSY